MADIVERLRATLLDKDNFPRMKQEKWLPVGLAAEAAAEIERLRAALTQLAELGEQGMKPDYTEWLTFHDKVAQVARQALNEQTQKAADEPLPHFREMRGIFK